MDNLDLDVFEEFNSSQDSNSSFSSQETVPCAYFDNSISFCDQSQFVPNYNPNLATVEMPSYQNQNFGVVPVNSWVTLFLTVPYLSNYFLLGSSSNLTPNLYYNNNNNMNFNGYNNPGYFVCQGGPPTWQPSPQIQGDFSQVNSSILDFQNTPGEFSNVITGYGNIAPGACMLVYLKWSLFINFFPQLFSSRIKSIYRLYISHMLRLALNKQQLQQATLSKKMSPMQV